MYSILFSRYVPVPRDEIQIVPVVGWVYGSSNRTAKVSSHDNTLARMSALHELLFHRKQYSA